MKNTDLNSRRKALAATFALLSLAETRSQTSRINDQLSEEVAVRYLDECPIDVIRRFIRRSWHFIDAYCQGLSGPAATWAVKEQKSHWCILDQSFKALEAILN